MIYIKDLTAADVGRWVLFLYYGGQQLGRIKNWNDDKVFVVYQCEDQWDSFLDSAALPVGPQDLEWMQKAT